MTRKRQLMTKRTEVAARRWTMSSTRMEICASSRVHPNRSLECQC